MYLVYSVSVSELMKETIVFFESFSILSVLVFIEVFAIIFCLLFLYLYSKHCCVYCIVYI